MKRVVCCLVLFAALATAGCSPYNVDMSLEGINWFVIHPRLYYFEYPYTNPRCPYYDDRDCQWGPEVQQPTISAVNSAVVVPKLEEKVY